MNDLRKAAQQALEYLDAPSAKLWPAGEQHRIITALRAALTQPETEPEPAAPTPLNENEDDPHVLWAEIARLRADVAGPKGFATWQDAAIDERVRRVRAEQALGLNRPKPEPVAFGCFRGDVLLDDLVSDEASVDYWCASDEPEMQRLVKRALYTAPPQRKPLTDQEIIEAIKHISHNEMSAFAIARAIERILK